MLKKKRERERSRKREDIKKQRFTNWKKNDERVKRGKGGEREQTEKES